MISQVRFAVFLFLVKKIIILEKVDKKIIAFFSWERLFAVEHRVVMTLHPPSIKKDSRKFFNSRFEKFRICIHSRFHLRDDYMTVPNFNKSELDILLLRGLDACNFLFFQMYIPRVSPQFACYFRTNHIFYRHIWLGGKDWK